MSEITIIGGGSRILARAQGCCKPPDVLSYLAWMMLMGLLLVGPGVWAADEKAGMQSFVLREYLGQDWRHELVFFPLERPLSEEEGDGVVLLDPDGTEVPFQVSGEGEAARIAFHADLPAYGERVYRLARAERAENPSPLKIEQQPDCIRVINGLSGVAVPTVNGSWRDGPIMGVRMRSGAWIGGSRLSSPREIKGYEANVTAAGPVYVDIACRYRFAGGKTWTLQLRVIAGEPVVLLRETFEVAPDAQWEFVVNQGWSANHVFMRPGTGEARYQVRPIAFDDTVTATLCPWIQWWDAKQGLVFGLFRARSGDVFEYDPQRSALVRRTPDGSEQPLAAPEDDMLIAAAGDVAAWARSGPDVWDSAPQRFVRVRASADGELVFNLPLTGPGRFWLLAAGSASESLVADGEVAPAQRLMNRFCETPLDEVKDMPLRWERGAEYPRLVLKRDAVARLVASPNYDRILEKGRDKGDLKSLLLPAIAGQPVTAEPSRVEALKQSLLEKLDDMVAYFRYGNRGYPAAMFGTFIPRLDIGYVLPPMDLALGAGIFTQEEEERIFAQLAFVADKIYSPDYVSPGRSLTGNPNMVTAWAASLALMACMLPDNPHAPAWYREGMGRVDSMLETWQGPNGGWLEAPHYQMAAIDPIFLAKTAAVNSGFIDSKLDERLLRTIMFLAKISTPPDPRFGNLRHFPPLGNTYLMETSEVFGAAARLYRTAEPEKAAALQWMWRQQGKPYWAGLGGASMTDFYVELLANEAPDPPAPAWGSELFPGFGAVLRTGFPGERETYMVYLQGDVATAHYDRDQGSFELWGKGRPLCLDWGYRGCMAAWLHNRMSIGSTGKVQEFAAQPSADYLRGRQDEWDRQILLVKDTDPLGPNYFVIRDTTRGEGTADWWLWVNTRKDKPLPPIPEDGIFRRDLARDELPAAVRPDGGVLHLAGEHDVDMDIWFAPNGQSKLDALHFRRAAVATVAGYLGGGWSSWSEGRTDQLGLHLAQPRGEPLVAVLYPRLRDEATPDVQVLAEGRVIKISGPWGTDYAFLSLEPFEFEDGPIRFKGTAGAIQRRGDRVRLTLNAPGTVADGAAELKSEEPRTESF